jgi:hypothetical protein
MEIFVGPGIGDIVLNAKSYKEKYYYCCFENMFYAFLLCMQHMWNNHKKKMTKKL